MPGTRNIPDQLPPASFKADRHLSEKRDVSEHPSWSTEISGNASKSVNESREMPEQNFPQVMVTYADDLKSDRNDRKSNLGRDNMQVGNEYVTKPPSKNASQDRGGNTLETETSDCSGEFVPKFPGILSRGEFS